jgi:hypothetical protein
MRQERRPRPRTLRCRWGPLWEVGRPDVVEVEVVSVSSNEPSDLAEVAQPSRVEGPASLMWVGHDPF